MNLRMEDGFAAARRIIGTAAGGLARWASSTVTPSVAAQMKLLRSLGVAHWSRHWEYAWVLRSVFSEPGTAVLDAGGGGDSPLSWFLHRAGMAVTNVDLEPAPHHPGIDYVRADLRELPFGDGSFDVVCCVSVLEHLEQVEVVFGEMWRVLRPGGRLVVTMDVANYYRHNHTINVARAWLDLSLFGLDLPALPRGALYMDFPEIDQGEDEPGAVRLHVLGFYADKANNPEARS